MPGAFVGVEPASACPDAPFHIRVEDDGLLLRSIKFKTRLSPVTPELFIAGWNNVVFDRDAAGRITGFRYGSEDMPLAHFVKSEVPK